MRPLAVVMLIAWSCAAYGDVPSGVAERVARFIFTSCDYLTANTPEPHKPEPPEKKLAEHFGHIVKTRRRGIAVEYVLKSPLFDGWDVSYWQRGVNLKFPSTVAITIGDLQRFLGPDDAPDVDYAVAAPSSGDKESNWSRVVQLEDRVFDPKRDDYCHITVQAEADKKKGAARRVFSLRFID